MTSAELNAAVTTGMTTAITVGVAGRTLRALNGMKIRRKKKKKKKRRR